MASMIAQIIADEDAAKCRSIGEHGVAIIEEISKQKRYAGNILTHPTPQSRTI